jgi:CubicO group peptidase (beta-lactamase class C family)
MKKNFILICSIFLLYSCLFYSEKEEYKSYFFKKKFQQNEEKINQLKNNYESWLKQNYQKKVFPTIVTGIVQGKELIYSYKLGATDTTNYSTGSVTKTFTATLVMRAIEKGLISLNDPVTKYFPKLKLENPILESKPILIRNLLSHSSGLPDLRYYQNGKSHPSSETGLSYNISEQIYPTGFHYRYSNHGFQLLGEILQKVYGKPLKQIIEEDLFENVGMKYSQAAPTVTGAGGILTNLHDISRYAIMWLGEGKNFKEEKVLKASTVNLMLEYVTKIPNFSKTKKYCGLGWRTERDEEGVTTFFHIGGANYTAAWIQMFPKYDIAVFYLSNPKEYDDNLMSELILMQHKLGQLASEIVGEKTLIHKTKDSFPDLDLMNQYSGNYYSPINETKLKVTEKDEKIYFEFDNKSKYSIPFYTINVTSGPGGQGAYEFAYDSENKKVLGLSTFNAFYKKID